MGLCLHPVDALVSIAAQQEPRLQVADRLGEAVGPVPEPELSLVVGSPDVVGLSGYTGRTPGMLSAMSTALPYQTVVLQNLRRSGSGRQFPTRVSALQHVQ